MGLYGDKLTLGSTTAADNLAKSALTAFDGLTKSDGSGVDLLTKSAGTAYDGLTKSSGTQFDGLTGYGKMISNGDFEGLDSAGLAAGWTCPTGTHTIEDPGINGRSQKLTEYSLDDITFYQAFGFTSNERLLDLLFTYFTNSAVARLEVYQRGSDTLIYSIDVSPSETNVTVNLQFLSDEMTGLEFRLTGVATGDYLMLDDISLEAHNQDNLAYTI